MNKKNCNLLSHNLHTDPGKQQILCVAKQLADGAAAVARVEQLSLLHVRFARYTIRTISTEQLAYFGWL